MESRRAWTCGIAFAVALSACSGGGGGGNSSAGPSGPEPTQLALFAGAIGGAGSEDGPGAVARFSSPTGIATDAAGNLYVADTGNSTIRKIDRAGVVSTVAGTATLRGNADGTGSAARFGSPNGLAVDSGGNIYVLDAGNDTVRKITPASVVSTFVGDSNLGSRDGVGTAAQIYRPQGIVADGAGNVFLADTGNSTIRKVTPDGRVTTFAGVAGQTGSNDGTASAARFNAPSGVAADAAGNLYVSDGFNHAIRKITPGGTVSTLAGRPGTEGNTNGTGSDATFFFPGPIAVDGAGNVFVLERADPNLSVQDIRRIAPSGAVTTFAGPFASGASGLAVLGGNVYVTSNVDSVVRFIDASGAMTTLAGTPVNTGNVDGVGPAARFGANLGIAADRDGNLYVADAANLSIRRVARDASVATLASLPDASSTLLASIATDGAGNVYTGEARCIPVGHGALCSGTLRKLTPAGTLSAVTPSRSSDGTGTTIRIPAGIATDAAGNIYIADLLDLVVRKLTPDGDITKYADIVGFPAGIATDAAANVYVAESATIRKIASTGAVVTLFGTTGTFGSSDGVGPAARFNSPRGIAVDDAGNAYVADSGNHTIRKITPSGAVTTIAGTVGVQGFLPGPLPGILSAPQGVAVVGSDLYITMGAGIAVIHNRP